MIEEPIDPAELLAFIRSWFRLLASDKWLEACGLLDRPNCYGLQWTPDDIRSALDMTYGPECRFRRIHPEGPQFTDPDTTSGILHANVVAISDGTGYSAEHDVPLNGEWSDLTAQFEFLRTTDGLAIVLHDLHIL